MFSIYGRTDKKYNKYLDIKRSLETTNVIQSHLKKIYVYIFCYQSKISNRSHVKNVNEIYEEYITEINFNLSEIIGWPFLKILQYPQITYEKTPIQTYIQIIHLRFTKFPPTDMRIFQNDKYRNNFIVCPNIVIFLLYGKNFFQKKTKKLVNNRESDNFHMNLYQ